MGNWDTSQIAPRSSSCGGVPEGPTVQLTGMLMARSLLAMCRTRSPKYSSLQCHSHTSLGLNVLVWLYWGKHGSSSTPQQLYDTLGQKAANLVVRRKLPLQCHSGTAAPAGRITTSLGKSASSQWMAALRKTRRRWDTAPLYQLTSQNDKAGMQPHLSLGLSLHAQRLASASAPSRPGHRSGVPFCLISMTMQVWLSAMNRFFTVTTCTTGSCSRNRLQPSCTIASVTLSNPYIAQLSLHGRICHHTFVWQNTESGGPAVTSTANSYSLCLVHIFLLAASLLSVVALGCGDGGD